MGEGIPAALGALLWADLPVLTHHTSPIQKGHCSGVWGVLLTFLAAAQISHRKELRGGKIYLGSRFKVAVHVIEGARW